MTLSGAGRRLSMILRRASVLYGSQRHLGHLDQFTGLAQVPFCEGPRPRSCSTSRFGKGNYLACAPVYSLMVHAHFSSEANEEAAASAETVEEVYTKLLKSVEAKTMPPNAWLWSLIEKCTKKDDILLLFQILQRLRVFRLSSLRIHANFNCHLCLKVTEACVRCDALEYGMKTLWKHNLYGFTPTISSAHRLLLHAKKHGDVKLMQKIMAVIQKNSLPLQPGTADIVFSICYDTNSWKLLLKYAKMFLKAGVKLHRTAYDNIMDFAAKIGDAKSIWKTEKHRSKHLKRHTIATAFSCAKACLIDQKPESAAAIISLLYQDLPDDKKPYFADALQRLVSEWPYELLKKKTEEDGEVLAESLRSGIPVLFASLRDMGIGATMNLEALKF